MQFIFRQVDDNNRLVLNLQADGGPELWDYVGGSGTRVINGAPGAMSTGDDLVLVLDGANAQLFAAGASLGAPSSLTAANRGTAWRAASGLPADDGAIDHIAFFPRDVSGILPKGTF